MKRSIGVTFLGLTLSACLDPDPTASGSQDDGGTNGDDDGGSMGPGSDTGMPLPDGSVVTVFDIQQGQVPQNSTVKLEGVVVTTPINAEEGAVLVQDPAGGPYSGLYLYMFGDVVETLALAPGDVIDVTGDYAEYYDSSQLTVRAAADLVVVGQDQPPAPLEISAADLLNPQSAEPYEGVLVTLTDVDVTNPDLGHGDFEVASGVVVTNFFLYALDAPLYPLAGAHFEALTGAVLYSFEQFKVAPRTPADAMGGNSDPETLTIYDVRQGAVADGAPVRVEEVIVTSPFTPGGDTFFVQERDGGEYSAIAVFLPRTQGVQVQPGDVITIEGEYTEFFNQSQIRVNAIAGIEHVGTDDVPAPAQVESSTLGGGQSGEPWESVLVVVTDAVVSAEANADGEWEIDQTLIVEPLFVGAQGWPLPAEGATFASIIGILDFALDDFRLAPLDADDVVPQ